MIESMADMDLTNEFWDCECEKNYIHPLLQSFCPVCKLEKEDGPDSRVIEVLKYGFAMPDTQTKIIAAKKLAFNWMENNININKWLEAKWISLNNEFYLNIYLDAYGKKRATLFSVVNGKTDLEHPIEIL